MKSGDHLRVFHAHNNRDIGTVVKFNAKSVWVKLPDGSTKKFAANQTQLLKSKTKRSRWDKMNDCVLITKRRSRYMKPPSMVQSRFDTYNPTKKMGNYKLMVLDKDIMSKSCLIFNDNVGQWARAVSHPYASQPAGGGNAAVRPWECEGLTIGIPTGISSLTSRISVELHGTTQYLTGKQIVDIAITRIVNHIYDNPKIEDVYYCVNNDDPPESTRLGLGIFAHCTGEDVTQYISDQLQLIPRCVQMIRQGRLSRKKIESQENEEENTPFAEVSYDDQGRVDIHDVYNHSVTY